MQPKQSEGEWTALARRHGFKTRKNPDRAYCPRCRHLLPKIQEAVDYDTWVGRYGTLVEVKQGATKGDSFRFKTSISDIQREELDHFAANHGVCWLFLVLGVDMRTTGRAAWLIPWHAWKHIEEALDQVPLKSLSYKKADIYIPLAYKLPWNQGGWEIPLEHQFQHYYGVSL